MKKKKIHYTENYLLSPHHPVSVIVIGAGGTGSQVITSLARMDRALQALGHPGLYVTVYDPDAVSESNIGRQLFSEPEIGLNKAVALVTRINRFSARHGQRNPAVIRCLKQGRERTVRRISSSPVPIMYVPGLRSGGF